MSKTTNGVVEVIFLINKSLLSPQTIIGPLRMFQCLLITHNFVTHLQISTSVQKNTLEHKLRLFEALRWLVRVIVIGWGMLSLNVKFGASEHNKIRNRRVVRFPNKAENAPPWHVYEEAIGIEIGLRKLRRAHESIWTSSWSVELTKSTWNHSGPAKVVCQYVRVKRYGWTFCGCIGNLSSQSMK